MAGREGDWEEGGGGGSVGDKEGDLAWVLVHSLPLLVQS